jgi:8-oxo-dGTP diphosphatase
VDSHVVVAAVLVRDGRILLCHRGPGRDWYPDVWDLPGGHIRNSETAQDALVRELAEEIGVKVHTPLPPPVARITSEGLDLTIYKVESWVGRVTNLDPQEHDQLDWFSYDNLRSLRLAHPTYLTLLSGLAAASPANP